MVSDITVALTMIPEISRILWGDEWVVRETIGEEHGSARWRDKDGRRIARWRSSLPL
jgi:hypothetical protein